MLDQAIERFDSDFYKVWQKYAYRILEQLEVGLQKLEFPENNKPDEIVELEVLIGLAKIEKDKKIFIRHIGKIQEILDRLASTKDFNDSQANNFIFHCRRSFNWLSTALLNEYLKYGQAVMNPADKPEIKNELGLVQKFAVKKGVKNINRQVLSAININVTRFNAIQVESMPQLKIERITDVPQPNILQSILAKRLDPEKYSQLKSQLPVNSAEDAAKYLSEQIHGSAFEFYYSQIATLYSILSKVDKMSRDLSKSPEEVKEYKRQLLSESGLGDLGTVQGKNLLNNVAQHLGFESAEELYQNYTNLYNEEEFKKLKDKKQDFMSYANRQDVYKENDPLEKIKRTFRTEYDRVLEKTKKKTTTNNNAAYATVICYGTIDYVAAIEGLQKKKNLAKIVAQDILDPRQRKTNVGFIEKWAMRAAFFAMENLNFKERMDALLFSNLYNDQALYERRLLDSTAELNTLWLDHTQKERTKAQAKREKAFSKVDSLSENERVDKFVSKIQKYKTALKGQSKSFVSEEEKLQERLKFDQTNKSFLTYREAFDLKENTSIYSMSATDLENYIKEKTALRNDLLQDMHQREGDLKAYFKEQSEKSAKPEKTPSLFKRFIAAMPWQRHNEKRKAKAQKEKQHKADKFERLGLQLEIETDLLQRALNQKNLNATYDSQDISSLRKEIVTLINDFVTLRDQMKQEDEFLTTDEYAYQHYYAQKKALMNVENRLNIALTHLTKKIKTPSEKTQLIEQGRIGTQAFLAEISEHKAKLGSNTQVEEIEKVLIELDKQSTQLKQSQLLTLAKTKVDSILVNPDILENGDPFLELQTQGSSLLESLNHENKSVITEYMKTQFVTFLRTKADALDRKTLEKFLVKMEYGSLLYSNKKEPTEQDKSLSTAYQSCIVATQSIIEAKYQQIKALDPDELRSAVAQLDADLSYLCNQIIDAKQQREMLQQSYDSWLSNPFGLVFTKETLEASDYNVIAHQKRLAFFSHQFLGILEGFLSDAPNYYPTLSLDVLNNHISRLRVHIEALNALKNNFSAPDELAIFNEIIKKHEKILESAIAYEKNHLEHPINSINLSLGGLTQKNDRLFILQEKILQELNLSYQLNASDLESYTQLLTQAHENLSASQVAFTDFSPEI